MKTLSFPRLLKKFMPLVYVLAVVLTLLVGFVGYSTSRKIDQTITQQFNEQQLILARKISDHIQDQISHLEVTLLLAGKIGESNDLSTLFEPGGILFQFQDLLSGDVLAILIQDEKGKILGKILNPEWKALNIPLPGPRSLFPQQESGLFANRVWIGTTTWNDGRWIIPLGVPLQKIRAGEKVIKGAIFFIIDAVHIAQKATQGVVSGNTGYAWIINRDGIILDHPEKDFIGKSIFWVLKTTSPHLSIKKIDDLIRKELLLKKEGTSAYILGWHRSRKNDTEKLMAYAPIPFFQSPERTLRPHPFIASEFWSVALVAPIEEISGLVRNLNLRQAFLIAIFQLTIIAGTGFLIFLSNRWSRTLNFEIKNKTEELRKSQEKLIQSERLAAVGSMASHVSHEIKNPLIAIGGLAQQLKRFPLLGEKEKQKLETITSEVTRLENILWEVRDFSRPTIPHKRQAQVNHVLSDLEQLFSPLFTKQQIKVQTHFDPALVDFFFDPDQIKQVLINLIENAVEAMPEGGTLSLTTKRDQDSVYIRVSDTGKGIDGKIKEQLFRPFVTNKKKGTGLGLAVSYKLIQDHNGDILVESSEKGTAITVQLPIEKG